MTPPDASELCHRLGVELGQELLTLALTHRSYAYENGGLPTNERLEFLGDSVLGMVVTAELYRRFPELPEGQLAKLRAAVVNSRSLADLARGLDAGRYVRLGRGELLSGGPDKSSILADALEALIGAVYIEHGIEVAAALVHRLVEDRLQLSASLGAGLDWKTSLQERTALLGLGSPEYAITGEGPDHARTFHAVALVAGESRGHGDGSSKKEAEQVAASRAFAALEPLIQAASRSALISNEPTADTSGAAAMSEASTPVVPTELYASHDPVTPAASA